MGSTTFDSALKRARLISQQKTREKKRRKKQKAEAEKQKRLKEWEKKFLALPKVRRELENLKFSHLKDPDKTTFSVLEVDLLKISLVFSNIILYEDETVEIVLWQLYALENDLDEKERLWLQAAKSPLEIDFSILLAPKELDCPEEAIDNAFVVSFASKEEAFDTLTDYFRWVSENPDLN
ncbi:MAG: hypothetical protein WD552_02730 [Candidatus Paceibacterota bacterium]